MSLIEIQGLSVTRSGGNVPSPLLDRVDLTIQENSVNVVIGESGAGKTILAKSLAALLPVELHMTWRSFFYRGKAIDNRWLTRRRGRDIFYIPQNAAISLNPVIKIWKQILDIPGISREKFITLLDSLDVKNPGNLLDRYAFQNSEGENQRILLAMALTQQPDLLILDEPTSALHRQGIIEFKKLLMEIMAPSAMTLLLLTHDVMMIGEAYRVIILKEGKVLDSGPLCRVFEQTNHEYTREIGYRLGLGNRI